MRGNPDNLRRTDTTKPHVTELPDDFAEALLSTPIEVDHHVV